MIDVQTVKNTSTINEGIKAGTGSKIEQDDKSKQ